MRITPLHDHWTFQQWNCDPPYPRPQLKAREWLPATVPGCVHLDLMANGVIADPFRRRFEIGAQWIDEADWVYRTTFEWHRDTALPRRLLKFHGLDTIASIWLNGSQIGAADSFFLPLELDVSNALLDGENVLEVRLYSAVRIGMERRASFFEKLGLPQTYGMFDERAFVRKPGYMSGWDWGPRLLGCGIWQPVELLEFASRLVNLDVAAAPEPDGRFRVIATAEGEGEGVVDFQFEGSAQAEPVSIADRRAEWLVRGDLWWPKGMGAQPLYTVRASLPNANELEKKIGLRTIRLIRQPDAIGESFEFEVNGKLIWSRGANWIPNDSFPSRITSEDYKVQVKRFTELNMNMLRVWGGGFYESEAFYDACDELGILVWQDFPFGCMYYPDDSSWQWVIKQEASHHVRRLRHRASLALWCGNNENHVMHQTRWAGDKSPDRYFGENLYEKTLPQVVEELNPETAYISTSPIGMTPDESIPFGPDRNDGMDRYGDAHYWDVWHGRGDWPHYRDSRTRFSSEFGFASSCSLRLWQQTIVPREFPSAELLHHDKTGKPWEKFFGYVLIHYPEPKTLEDWAYYSQLNQRDALRCGIEHFRRLEGCRGSLIWQANDCWPVQSWAVQDHARRLKPAGFELQRLYADLLLSIDHLVGFEQAGIHVVNDGSQLRKGEVAITAHSTLNGEVIRHFRIPFEAAPDTRDLLHDFALNEYPATTTAIKFEIIGEPKSVRWIFLAEPKDMKFGPVTLRRENAGIVVKGFVADLVVWDEDEPDAIISTRTSQPGWCAETVANGTAPFKVNEGSKKLRARSLAGSHEIV
jgi:beta-mannosidase